MSDYYSLQYLNSVMTGVDLVLEFDENREKIFRVVEEELEDSNSVQKVVHNDDLHSLLAVLPDQIAKTVENKQQESPHLLVTEVTLDLVQK